MVARIFKLTKAGFGPTHIAKQLRADKIETPAAHFHRMGVKCSLPPPADPYDWNASTIVLILSRLEYLGHTVNFKSYVKSYKNRKIIQNDPSEYVIIRDTHPAITDQDTFDCCQRLRSGKRRRAGSGRVSPFSGLLLCGDCGSKMYFCSGESQKPNQDNYVCSGFRGKKVQCCHSHYIRLHTLTDLVLERLQNILTFAAKYEKEFVQLILKDSSERSRKELLADKKQLIKIQRRITELDTIVQQLYEDSVFGRLSNERFIKLSESYELEQKELNAQYGNLQQEIGKHEEQTVNVERFLALVRKYTRITEITPTILNEFIHHIKVQAPDKNSGKRKQGITICYNFIGEIGKLDLERLKTADSAEIETESPGLGILGQSFSFSHC